MSVPTRIVIGGGVWTTKWSAGGVSFSKFRASVKKGKISAGVRRIQRCDLNLRYFIGGKVFTKDPNLSSAHTSERRAFGRDLAEQCGPGAAFTLCGNKRGGTAGVFPARTSQSAS